MHGERPDDSITDEELDRELQRALAVDPSTEFLPRLRMRLVADRSAPRWSVRWSLAVTAVATIIVLAGLGIWSGREERDELPRRAAPVSSASVSPTAPSPTPSADRSVVPVEKAVVVSPMLALTDKPRVRRPRMTARAAPEVLIAADEAEALRRLFADISARRLEVSMLPAEPASEPLMPISTISIEPITVEPLVTAGSE